MATTLITTEGQRHDQPNTSIIGDKMFNLTRLLRRCTAVSLQLPTDRDLANLLATQKAIKQQQQQQQQSNDKSSGNGNDGDGEDDADSPYWGGFLCKFCGNVFEREQLFKSHLESQHATTDRLQNAQKLIGNDAKCKIVDETLTCEICGLACDSGKAFRRHLAADHDRYLCRKCYFVGSTKNKLKYHVQKAHASAAPELRYNCQYCDATLMTYRSLLLHRSRKHLIPRTMRPLLQ